MTAFLTMYSEAGKFASKLIIPHAPFVLFVNHEKVCRGNGGNFTALQEPGFKKLFANNDEMAVLLHSVWLATLEHVAT